MGLYIVSTHNIQDLKKATTNPFGNRYIARMDGVNIAFVVEQDKIVILFEEFDNTKLTFDGKAGDMTQEYAVIAAAYSKRKVSVGTKEFLIDYIINHPEGEYYNTFTNGQTVLHQKEGKLFIDTGGVYLAVSDKDMDTLMRGYVNGGNGSMISDQYLVRVNDCYYPVKYTYMITGVAMLMIPGTTEDLWLSINKYLG